jgi:hypothetical protein
LSLVDGQGVGEVPVEERRKKKEERRREEKETV